MAAQHPSQYPQQQPQYPMQHYPMQGGMQGQMMQQPHPSPHHDGGMTPGGMTPGGMAPGGMTPGGMTPGQGPLPPGPGQQQGHGMTSPPREVNTASLCRIGQETVQDIVGKTNEIFQLLKNIQIPNGMIPATMQNYQERKAKLDDHMREIQLLFKKLRVVYTKVGNSCIPYDTKPIEDLIPFDGVEIDDGGARSADVVRFANEERRELAEQVKAKNKQLKDIIDQLRTIIWEINTMMAMKKT